MASAPRPRSSKQVIAPRLLARAALLAYLGELPWSVVQALIERGKLPGPLWKCSPDDADARWDRKTVDRALDAESEIPGSVEEQIRELDKALGLI